MKAILTKSPGEADQLYLGETSTPAADPGQLLIKVKASGVNRADILQRQGKYPPPKGESEIIGLEISGVVEEVGSDCTRYKKGDRVFALLAGGGYAEYVAIDERLVMPVPSDLSFEEAAGIAEVFLTAHQVLFLVAQLKQDEVALIHAGASGVGTAAIQLCRSAGAVVIVTAGSDEKVKFCQALGAEHGINYKTESDFATRIMEYTNGHGADVIIDPVGAAYFDRNLEAVAPDGRWVLLAAMGGAKVQQANLAKLLMKRVTLSGSTLRARSKSYKATLVHDFAERFLPQFETGQLKPVIDRVFEWQDVAEAHTYMEQNKNMGKIVLNGM